MTAALPHVSSAEDLALHGPRVMGFASSGRVAARFGLDAALVGVLLDHQAREVVTGVHREFLPLNRRFARACTRWQVRPTRLDPVARNDHDDWGWDEGVLRSLTALGNELVVLGERLSAALRRFDGYGDRYAAALARVDAGERRWVDAPEVDSCHTVWIQLHEDLLATLGIPRGSDG